MGVSILRAALCSAEVRQHLGILFLFMLFSFFFALALLMPFLGPLGGLLGASWGPLGALLGPLGGDLGGSRGAPGGEVLGALRGVLK